MVMSPRERSDRAASDDAAAAKKELRNIEEHLRRQSIFHLGRWCWRVMLPITVEAAELVKAELESGGWEVRLNVENRSWGKECYITIYDPGR